MALGASRASYRKSDFAGIRVMAHALARSPEPGSITDVAASIEHGVGSILRQLMRFGWIPVLRSSISLMPEDILDR
jgi:hypothetical protein